MLSFINLLTIIFFDLHDWLSIVFHFYSDKKDGIIDGANLSTDGTVFSSPPIKRAKMMAAPSLNERVMLYVRQETDDVYTPLHVVPPTTQGLLNAVSA
jgi:transcription factor CP2-like protein